MNREESWGVERVTFTLLRHITSLGYTVSAHRIPASLLNRTGAFVEMHAIDERTDPPRSSTSRASASMRAGTRITDVRVCWLRPWAWIKVDSRPHPLRYDQVIGTTG